QRRVGFPAREGCVGHIDRGIERPAEPSSHPREPLTPATAAPARSASRQHGHLNVVCATESSCKRDEPCTARNETGNRCASPVPWSPLWRIASRSCSTGPSARQVGRDPMGNSRDGKLTCFVTFLRVNSN